MKLRDIEPMKVSKEMPPDGKRVRAKAPQLLASVINETHALKSVRSLDELRPEHVEALKGGVDAATYLLNIPHERVVVKFSYHGVDAEAETIEAWRKRHVRTPRIVASGVVPLTKDDAEPVKYMVQQALVDEEGRLIETSASYLVHAPDQARAVGRAMGRQLSKVHSSVSSRRYGEFHDASSARHGYGSWNAYMGRALDAQREYLRKIGVDDVLFNKIAAAFERRHYVSQGRYLHGDFSIRNIAIKAYDPLKVSVFDPNPIIGDPSWDISFLRNNYEFEKYRLAFDESQRDLYTRNQQLWVGFKQGYTRRIDYDNLLTAQFIQAIYQAQHQEGMGDSSAFRARREFLLHAAGELAALS